MGNLLWPEIVSTAKIIARLSVASLQFTRKLILPVDCCQVLTFQAQGTNIDQAYQSFLGIWAQDGNFTSVGPAKRPIYRKLDNPNLYLASVEVIKLCDWVPKKPSPALPSVCLQGNINYPLPWIMWGGPHYIPGEPNGNLKFGHRVQCPEHLKVEGRGKYYTVAHTWARGRA